MLSPKHSRELTPTLCLDIAASLSSVSREIIPYTLWITEAWRVLGWAEPSAALFWEMATMYHTLYISHHLTDETVIPPILSCGSHSSMGSAPQQQNQSLSDKQKKQYSTAAKELPVWLIGTFLLLHCEESAYRRNISAEETGQTEIQTSWQQKNQSAK